MSSDDHATGYDRLTARGIELAIRLAVLGLLLYFAFVLIRPFITIAIWSVVLTVALYPAYERMVRLCGGRRRLAAILLTIISLLIVIGPAAWLALGLIDSIQKLSEHVDLSTLKVPEPSARVKSWPLVGDAIYQFWELAAANLQAALARIAPQLKPIARSLLGIAAGTGAGAIKFLIAIVIAGLLFPPAPAMVDALRTLSRRLALEQGETFVQIAGTTIRAVARGVIGISALQAFLIGVGVVTAGIPAAAFITSAALILGIIQIGPAIVVIPLIIWSWTTMETTTALLFTAYMVPVSLLDNVLRPLVMGRGLDTPIVVILIGVIGGTLSLGITGLFLGPIILAVIWELSVAWIKESA
jgi:predicted PurR-regulated permease PerM